MPRDKYAYDKQYNKEHTIRKFIPFNNLKPDDMELLDWINRQGNATQYIKTLVREDMERKTEKTSK